MDASSEAIESTVLFPQIFLLQLSFADLTWIGYTSGIFPKNVAKDSRIDHVKFIEESF